MCEGAVQRVSVSKARISDASTPGLERLPAGSSARTSNCVTALPVFLSWRLAQAWRILKAHPLLLFVTVTFVLSIPLELHAITMVPPGGEPFDAGFLATHAVHQFLKRRPALNDLLAAANTGLVMLQILYILGSFFVTGRLRPTLASLFMYSSRGFLGWSTQLPVPRDFLVSSVDFPVGRNASFFLFFSGHVGASIIAAMDLRRTGRTRAALVMDAVNAAQTLRLLATRGHYTIDLASGAVAGWICYHLAAWYEQGMQETLHSHHGLDRKHSVCLDQVADRCGFH